jgi:hypothetical protein
LYDEKHRYQVLTTIPEQKNSIEQKGVRERLLCGDCENRISRYERYAALVLNGGAKGIDARREGNLIYLNGIDYATFKLFELSLLWRAGVSKLHAFERVNLGPHQEKIRGMLLQEDPGPAKAYPCVLFALTMTPGKVPGLMIPPNQSRSGGARTYYFVLPGLMLVYSVASHSIGWVHSKCVLQENGSQIIQVRRVMELEPLHKFMRQFDSLGREPPLRA